MQRPGAAAGGPVSRLSTATMESNAGRVSEELFAAMTAVPL
jgi:hypothetical protein